MASRPKKRPPVERPNHALAVGDRVTVGLDERFARVLAVNADRVRVRYEDDGAEEWVTRGNWSRLIYTPTVEEIYARAAEFRREWSEHRRCQAEGEPDWTAPEVSVTSLAPPRKPTW